MTAYSRILGISRSPFPKQLSLLDRLRNFVVPRQTCVKISEHISHN
jgi:hypothetical protein